MKAVGSSSGAKGDWRREPWAATPQGSPAPQGLAARARFGYPAAQPNATGSLLMNTRRLRVGVAGAGHFGRYHALKLAASARGELVGVHDRNPERARVVAAEAGGRALSFPELLAACEAVVVAVPA